MPSRRPVSSPRRPVGCRGPNCTALVWIKSVLNPAGGKLLRLPLEAAPSEDGTVAARPYATTPGRFLARGEQPRDGELRWASHFDTCPDAASFRKPPARDPQPALFPATDTPEGTP